uniref:Serine/arginine repetitive matrix protein 1-like n=1 Tax=Panagrellus redivivus TaxID=6233 RepID=A0A7E4WAG8_PANRE
MVMNRRRSKSAAYEGHGVAALPPLPSINDRNRKVAERQGAPPPQFAPNSNAPENATARERAANHIINPEPVAAAINNARNRRRSLSNKPSAPPAPRGRGRPPKEVPGNRPQLVPQESRAQLSNVSYRAVRTSEKPLSRNNNNNNRVGVKPEQESEISFTDDSPSYNSNATRKRSLTREPSEGPGPSRPPKAPRKSRSRGPVTPAPNGINYSSTRGPVARPERFGASSSVTSPSTPRKLPKAMVAAASVADRYAGRKPVQQRRETSTDSRTSRVSIPRNSRAGSRTSRSPSAPTNSRRSVSVVSNASTAYRRQRDRTLTDVPDPNIPFHPNPSVIIYKKVRGNRNPDVPFPNTFMKDPRLEDNEDDTQLVMDALYDYMDTHTTDA